MPARANSSIGPSGSVPTMLGATPCTSDVPRADVETKPLASPKSMKSPWIARNRLKRQPANTFMALSLSLKSMPTSSTSSRLLISSTADEKSPTPPPI